MQYNMQRVIRTISALIQDTYFSLMKARIDPRDEFSPRINEEQARHLMYRIPVYIPTPPFIVDSSHLEKGVYNDLMSLDEVDIDHVFKEAIGKIFENLNLEYFLWSVKSLLRWEWKK